jgi:hypothetical protein
MRNYWIRRLARLSVGSPRDSRASLGLKPPREIVTFLRGERGPCEKGRRLKISEGVAPSMNTDDANGSFPKRPKNRKCTKFSTNIMI